MFAAERESRWEKPHLWTRVQSAAQTHRPLRAATPKRVARLLQKYQRADAWVPLAEQQPWFILCGKGKKLDPIEQTVSRVKRELATRKCLQQRLE